MRRRTRILFRSSLVVLVIMGMTVGLLLSYDGFRRKREFRAVSATLLTQLSNGEVRTVHDGASIHFQEKQLFNRLEDVVDRMNLTLGKFKKVVRVIKNERAQSIEGTTAKIEYELEFEAALVQGNLSYVQEHDKKWKLLGFDLSIPAALVEKSEKLRLDPKRLEAPMVVLEEVYAIVDDMKNKKVKKIYQRASKRFQLGTTSERLIATVNAQAEELGAIEKVSEIVDTAQNEKRSSAHVDVILKFSIGETPAGFRFIYEDDAWKLISFNLKVPEPMMPKKEEGK